MSEPITIKIEGMGCQGCVAAVEKALKAAAPGARIDVSLADGRANVSETSVDRATLSAAIAKAGYDVIP